MKKKDILKNILLSLLVCSSVLLCLYIFMGPQLWPSGYNFFMGENSGFVGRIISAFSPVGVSGSSIATNSIIKPDRIVITNDGKRSVITGKDTSFKKICEDMGKIISGLNTEIGNGNPKEIDSEELFKALKFKSIFIDYGEAVPVGLWKEATGVKDLGQNISMVKNVAIVTGDSVSGKLEMLLTDAESGKKYLLQTENSNEYINGFIDKNMVDAQSGWYPFSFELNFDEVSSGQKRFVQKVVLDSLVTVNLNDIKVPSVSVSLPLHSTMQEQVENIVRLFGFRLGAIKRYVEMNNAVQFVENYATLKVSPDGLVEYQAIEAEKGLQLFEINKDKSQDTVASQSLRNASGLIQTINKSTGAQGGSLELYSMDYDSRSGLYTFCFDYNVNGIPYLINSGATHAAEVTVLGGKVQSIKQYVRGFEVVNSTVTVLPLIKALDKVKSDGKTGLEITDTFIAYLENGDRFPMPYWCAKQKGGQGIVTMN